MWVFFKEARPGSMIKIPKLGLGSGSTLEARARLGLEKCGLVPPLVRLDMEYKKIELHDKNFPSKVSNAQEEE